MEAPFRWRFHRALKFAENANLPAGSIVDRHGNPLTTMTTTTMTKNSGLKRTIDEAEGVGSSFESGSGISSGGSISESGGSSGSSGSVAKRSRLSNGLDEQLRDYRRQLEEMQRELKLKEEEKQRVRSQVEMEDRNQVEAQSFSLSDWSFPLQAPFSRSLIGPFPCKPHLPVL